MKTKSLSLVAALALSVSSGFATIGDTDTDTKSIKLNVASSSSSGWTLIGAPAHVKWSQDPTTVSASVGAYDPVSFTGAMTIIDRNTSDGEWNTSVEQNASVAIVRAFGYYDSYNTPNSSWQSELSLMYDDTNATDFNLTVEFVPKEKSSMPSPLKVMYIDTNMSSDATPVEIGYIKFDEEYVGEKFNLTIGLGGDTTPIADVNHSFTFEAGKRVYIAIDDTASGSSSSGVYAESAFNNFVRDIDVNTSLTSSGRITNNSMGDGNATSGNNVDLNLTVLTFRNGAWYEWKYAQNAASPNGSTFSIYTNTEDPNSNVDDAARKIFENNNTEEAAAYWFYIESNLSNATLYDYNSSLKYPISDNGEINYLIADSEVTADKLAPVLTERTDGEAWSLVTLPEGPIINAQTGLCIEAGGFINYVAGLYGEELNMTISTTGTTSDAAGEINRLIGLADKNGSAHLKVKAYAATECASGNAGVLLLADHKIKTKANQDTLTLAGGRTVAANIIASSLYGEQGIAFRSNGSNAATTIGFEIPNEDTNTSFKVNLPTLTATNLETAITGATGISANDVGVTVFSLASDTGVEMGSNYIIAFAPASYRTSNAGKYLRFGINEETYVKTYKSGVDQNLSVVYIYDDNRTSFADVNITANGTADLASGTMSISGSDYSWAVATSGEGNWTYFYTNNRFVDIVERSGNIDQIQDVMFTADKNGNLFNSASEYTLEYNSTNNIVTDINKSTGAISFVWTLDKLTSDSLDMNSSNTIKLSGDLEGSALIDDLKTGYVWSAATTKDRGILKTLNSIGDGFLLREAWTYKEDNSDIWYQLDLTGDPATWVDGDNNLFSTRIGDGYWIKTVSGQQTLTAPTVGDDQTVKVITRFSNEENTSTNYLFVEKYITGIQSVIDSSFVNVNDYKDLVIDVSIANDYQTGKYLPTGTDGGSFHLYVNPYTMPFTDEATMSSIAIAVSDGVSDAVSTTMSLSGTYSKPNAPSIEVTDMLSEITISNLEDSNDSTLVFESYVSEANLTAQQTTDALSVRSSLVNNGRISALDFDDSNYTGSTPTNKIFKFVNKEVLDSGSVLYSDMAVLNYLPIFGARWKMNEDNITVEDLNQTKMLKDSSGDYITATGPLPKLNSNFGTNVEQNVTHIGSLLTSNSLSLISTKADRFDQWLNPIDTTYASQMDTTGTQPLYDPNSISFGSAYTNPTSGNVATVSIAYRPMFSAYGYESGNNAKLMVNGTHIASVSYPDDYNASVFYIWFADDTNRSVYYGMFDYNTQDSNQTINLTEVPASSTACFVSTDGGAGTYSCD